MSIRLLASGTIELGGTATIEDAEKLQQYLIADPAATVDWRSCASAHTAVVQLLLAASPNLMGPPQGDFLRQHIAALFEH